MRCVYVEFSGWDFFENLFSFLSVKVKRFVSLRNSVS